MDRDKNGKRWTGWTGPPRLAITPFPGLGYCLTLIQSKLPPQPCALQKPAHGNFARQTCLARASGMVSPLVGWGSELSEPRRKNSVAKTNLRRGSFSGNIQVTQAQYSYGTIEVRFIREERPRQAAKGITYPSIASQYSWGLPVNISAGDLPIFSSFLLLNMAL